MAEIWGYYALPAELRLRVLNNTHLGPPETGGYAPEHECLFIHDGRIVPSHPSLQDPEPESTCSSPQTHHTSTPQCTCRILPTPLLRTSHQTRAEALAVLAPNLHLDLSATNPHTTHAFLAALPTPLPDRLTLTFTPAQIEGWFPNGDGGGGAVASGYPAAALEQQIAIPHWGGGRPPAHDYRGAWRALVALLAARADLPRLALTVDMAEAAWPFVEDALMAEDEVAVDVATYRFIYDFYVDVVAALCALGPALGSLALRLSVFAQLRPWLEREVLGRATEGLGAAWEPGMARPVFGSVLERRRWEEVWLRPRAHQVVPPWHDGGRRLEGSNYHPEGRGSLSVV